MPFSTSIPISPSAILHCFHNTGFNKQNIQKICFYVVHTQKCKQPFNVHLYVHTYVYLHLYTYILY